MADHERSGRKRHKAERREHVVSSSERRRRDRDSRDHGSGSAAPQLTSVPWHAMQFQLIDCVNGYAAGKQETDGSCIVRGRVGDFDMSSFSGLVSYVCRTFEIDSELRTVFLESDDCKLLLATKRALEALAQVGLRPRMTLV